MLRLPVPADKFLRGDAEFNRYNGDDLFDGRGWQCASLNPQGPRRSGSLGKSCGQQMLSHAGLEGLLDCRRSRQSYWRYLALSYAT
jgi:hypothetical protein